MKNTALHAAQISAGGHMAPFAGWEMPVHFGGILDEVSLVRTKAGLFDLGHMGRVRVEGVDATDFLQRLQTNDASKLVPGGIRYSLILDDGGMILDDILIYRDPDDDGFFLVINASNTQRDLDIMRETAQGFGDVRIIDQTDDLGMFAIQGPASAQIIASITDIDLDSLAFYRWTRGKVAGVETAVSRTGYTGEDGFEIYASRDDVANIWDATLGAGEASGLRPAGLGSRDTLRLEAGMTLYGHEIDETTNPLEAGLSWAVKFTHDFTGREALEQSKAAGGTGRLLVGLKTTSRRVPRQGYTVTVSGEPVGSICSGSISPTLSTNIATAYLAAEYAEPGTKVDFMVRDKPEPATVVTLPFYKRPR
ncbi:MAG: glycine cleavage system aminomethyltransferase GcvT [Planctomycetota bacterium]|nr:glycine cleavage system aminomethyltransferase GcvT [Planctomycetota bacterium]